MAELEKSEAKRREKNRYQNKWRSNNKDRVRSYNLRYWKKKIAELEEDVSKEGEVIDELLNKASENK